MFFGQIKGLLWTDRFFCGKENMELYLNEFKRHRLQTTTMEQKIKIHDLVFNSNFHVSWSTPKKNNVSWRGDSCLDDGYMKINDLVDGYYDAGGANKFHFPASFAMTMLNWSVLEYNAKHRAVGELKHVREIIKWGTNYLLQTFDYLDYVVSQVVGGDTSLDGTNFGIKTVGFAPKTLASTTLDINATTAWLLPLRWLFL
ncbi:hypothetical protein FNV43_RR13173 [Rhamnella rubrinervis]|uniref:cellulase n=1 Tax=Rhamnella rubrinervis TaxID=2594499 RepID=A0A8K0H0P7_9ROSA|nr:hypothetical protein FNV43_RR13173 [Rhamnella rubrinervis]